MVTCMKTLHQNLRDNKQRFAWAAKCVDTPVGSARDYVHLNPIDVPVGSSRGDGTCVPIINCAMMSLIWKPICSFSSLRPQFTTQ